MISDRPSRPAARKNRKRLLLAAGLCLLLPCLGMAALKVFIWHQARKVEALALAMQTIVPGASSREDAERIARRFGGTNILPDRPCNQDQCTWEMTVLWIKPGRLPSSPWGEKIFLWTSALLDHRPFSRLGIHSWMARSWIHLQGNTVSFCGMEVYAEGEHHQWMDGGWSLYREVPEEVLKVSPAWPPSKYIVRWHHLHMGLETGEGLHSYVSLAIPVEYRRRAQALNYTCLTGSVCSGISGLYPEAARDHQLFVDCIDERRRGQSTQECAQVF
jgi:hypothetical protein